jgi:carbonic anhydrase
MDAALAKLFVSNAQWVKAVNTTESGFFEQSAKGQSPKVRFRLR